MPEPNTVKPASVTKSTIGVKDLRIAYIGGGSRGWAWTFMRDLALEPALGGTIVLYDIDKEAAKAAGVSKRELYSILNNTNDIPKGEKNEE